MHGEAEVSSMEVLQTEDYDCDIGCQTDTEGRYSFLRVWHASKIMEWGKLPFACTERLPGTPKAHGDETRRRSPNGRAKLAKL